MSDEWMRHANCAGTPTDLFFPERGGDARPAKKICYACTVRAECLTYAMRNGEKCGIYGGYSAKERRLLRKRYKVRAVA